MHDKESNKRACSTSPNFGILSHRAELFFNSVLIIIDKAPIRECRLFNLVDLALEDVPCQSKTDCRPMLGGICLDFSEDDLQLLPVFPSGKCVEDEHEMGGTSIIVSWTSLLGGFKCLGALQCSGMDRTRPSDLH